MEGQTQFVVSQCFTEFHEVASRIFPNGRGRGFRSPGCVFYFHLMDIFQAIRQVHFIHLQGTHIIILLMKLQVTQEGTLQGGGVGPKNVVVGGIMTLKIAGPNPWRL